MIIEINIYLQIFERIYSSDAVSTQEKIDVARCLITRGQILISRQMMEKAAFTLIAA